MQPSNVGSPTWRASWGPRGPKRARDRWGLREAQVRTQSPARLGLQPARTGQGSSIKTRRSSRGRGRPTHLVRGPSVRMGGRRPS